jgi:hypothetical protein
MSQAKRKAVRAAICLAIAIALTWLVIRPILEHIGG